MTADSYILGVFRIPGTPDNPSPTGKPVVFLQHGLLCSSSDWIVLGPGKALAYLLADAGYDVWLGNARGNTNSRSHSYITPDKGAFWEFSWHQIGIYDLPAMIDFVLSATGETQLHYAGHSQGTTSFFVMTSLRPDYNDKIKAMHALAPVAFMKNAVSPMLTLGGPIVGSIDFVLSVLNAKEFLPNSQFLVNLGYTFCRDNSLVQEICANVMFLTAGFDSPQLNRTILPDILRNTPAGASIHQVTHYGQGAVSGEFRFFDYGPMENGYRYGQAEPPHYPLNRIRARVALHYSANDWFAGVIDVLTLADRLPNLIGKFLVPLPEFNHLDFTYAIDADTLLYNKIIAMMNEDNGMPPPGSGVTQF